MSLFSELYSTVRTLLGDVGAIPVYSNAQLDMGISLAVMQEDSYDEGLVGPDKAITPDIANKTDKLRISVRSAITLISPQSGASSYRTKVLSITRENSRNAHLGYLLSLLRDLEEGKFVVASETEWDLIIRGTTDAVSKLQSIQM